MGTIVIVDRSDVNDAKLFYAEPRLSFSEKNEPESRL